MQKKIVNISVGNVILNPPTVESDMYLLKKRKRWEMEIEEQLYMGKLIFVCMVECLLLTSIIIISSFSHNIYQIRKLKNLPIWKICMYVFPTIVISVLHCDEYETSFKIHETNPTTK